MNPDLKYFVWSDWSIGEDNAKVEIIRSVWPEKKIYNNKTNQEMEGNLSAVTTDIKNCVLRKKSKLGIDLNGTCELLGQC